MSLYGNEWRTSDVDAVDQLMEWLVERQTKRGCRVIHQRIVQSKEEEHWLMACDDNPPHAHLMLKWKDMAHG